MSKWTHINASIRFFELPDYSKILKIAPPLGSEGPLRFNIIKEDKNTRDSPVCISFTADLRDYDNRPEILEYFNKITASNLIKSGILEIDCPFSYIEVYRYTDANKWILVK